eukprot:297410-Pelagomonas_calceolata.AAC.1
MLTPFRSKPSRGNPTASWKWCPYELRICNKCDWHIVQDEEHVILGCPSQDLTELRTQFQH